MSSAPPPIPKKATVDDLLADQQNFHAAAIQELRALRSNVESVAFNAHAVRKSVSLLVALAVLHALLVAAAVFVTSLPWLASALR